MSEPIKITQSKLKLMEVFNVSWKKILQRSKKSENFFSLNEGVEATLKAFDMSFNKFRLYLKSFVDSFVEATIQFLLI